MSRYRNTPVLKDKDGNRYYQPTIIKNIPIKDSDIFVYPFDGDRLDILAQRYYNDSTLWWIIAKANEISDGKMGVSAEERLRVPTEISDLIQ